MESGRKEISCPSARDACRRQNTICVPAHSKNPGGLTFGVLACVKGEFFGIAIADLTSVIKSVYTIVFFNDKIYNYITER